MNTSSEHSSIDFVGFVELESVKTVMFDDLWKPISERWTTKWLDQNPKIKETLDEIRPGTYLEMQATEAIQKIYKAQKRHKQRLWLYIICPTVVWFVIYDTWGVVIGFISWYLLWYYFQPIKVMMRLVTK